MNLKIISVEYPGDLERERLILKAAEADNLGDYAIFQGTLDDSGLIMAGRINNAYWFNVQEIDSEYIVLYSKDGTESEKKKGDSVISRFFYWGSETPLWTEEYVPVIVSTPEWENLQSSAPGDPDEKTA
jgi:hypothetical protein